MDKKHKLVLIIPSGKELTLGFLSPSRNGFILGTVEVEGTDTSHLTILSKKGKISSHITPQKHASDKQYFPSMPIKKFSEAIQETVKENLFSPLTDEQLLQQVLYITQKFVDWLDSMKNTLYEKRVTAREVIHIINFEGVIEKMPKLIKELLKSTSSFFGLCQAKDLLEDSSMVCGFTETKSIVIPLENRLYLLNFPSLTRFTPTLNQEEIANPLSVIYRTLGLPQYMQETQDKKIIEKLLSKEK